MGRAIHYAASFPQIAEEISKPLSSAQKVTMVSNGGSEVGAAKLTGEVLDIMTRLPQTVERLTGVSISQVSWRLPPPLNCSLLLLSFPSPVSHVRLFSPPPQMAGKPSRMGWGQMLTFKTNGWQSTHLFTGIHVKAFSIVPIMMRPCFLDCFVIFFVILYDVARFPVASDAFFCQLHLRLALLHLFCNVQVWLGQARNGRDSERLSFDE